MQTQNSFSAKKYVVLILLLGVVAAGGFTAYRHFNEEKVAVSPAKPTYPVNYAPSTNQEKQQADAVKDNLAQTKADSPATGKTQVVPLITNASQIDQQVTVNAYISGVYENGGNCTATFTNGDARLVKTSSAFANASTTDCTPFRVARSEFSTTGDWQVKVSYNSPTASGDSQLQTMKLQ